MLTENPMIKKVVIAIAIAIAIACVILRILLASWFIVDYRNVVLSPRVDSSDKRVVHGETIGVADSPRTNEDTVANGANPTRRVVFIPFPHNTMGSGVDMECRWETKIIAGDDTTNFDSTQRAAFAEGVCIPQRLNASIHVFSSSEARECLRSKRVIISGDSFMKQLFIGLADILLSKKVNGDKQIIGREKRSQIVARTNKNLARLHKMNLTFPNVEYLCEEGCYGHNTPFSQTCSDCINSLTAESKRTVAVVGAGVHITRAIEDMNGVIEEVKKFLNLTMRTIFVSMPAGPFINETPLLNMSDKSRIFNEGLISYLAPHQPPHPFVDVFQLTRSCTMENCSYDGAHRSRYVNRWKAQLLLNTLCEIVE
jgi:hypothetical protein